MRVAYITNVIIPAGDAQSVQVAAMAQAFYNALRNDFVLVSPRSPGEAPLVAYRWVRVPVPAFFPRALRYAATLVGSVRTLFSFKPEYIYTRDIGVAVWCHIFGYATVYEIHKPFETVLGNWLAKKILKKIKVVAISHALCRYTAQKYGIHDNSITVAHDGVFVKEYAVLNKEACRGKLLEKIPPAMRNTPIALYSGTINVLAKGPALILEAARELPSLTFVLVGGSPSLPTVPRNVVFLPRLPAGQVAPLIKGADLVVLPFTKNLPTWEYQSPLKMFEYMASGVPIVASNVGSAAEVLHTGNATLFDPHEPRSLSKAIERSISAPEDAVQKAAQALREVQQYDWSVRVQKIFDFLDRKV